LIEEGIQHLVTEEERAALITRTNPVWGFWATFGFGLWVMSMNLLCELVVIVVFIAQQASSGIAIDQHYISGLQNNGLLVSIATIVAAPVCVGLIFFIIRLKKGSNFREYLGMCRIRWRTIPIALGILIIYFVLFQALSSFINYKGTNFTEDIFKTAGSVPLLWIATVVMAPVFEEALFRGFLFEGFRRSPVGIAGAVLFTSAFWAALHLQYDLFAIGSIFILGIIIGLVRYRMGSIWGALAMHMLFNLISMAAVTIQGAG
jgi:uncharacterized protein